MAEAATAPDHLATLEAALTEIEGTTPQEAPAPSPDEPEAAPAPADDTEQPEPANEAAPEQLGIRSLTDEQLVALRRAQITDADLAGLSDAALAQLASTAAKLRANYDRDFDAIRNQKPSTEAGRRKGEEGAGKAAAPDPSPVDLAALADPVRKALGLDDAEGKVLTEFTRQVLSAARAAYAPELEEVRQSAALANQRMGTMLADGVRDDLRADWPQIKDARKWEDVRAKARAISSGYEHMDLRTGMASCLRDAAMLVLGPPKAKATPQRQPDARKNGSPDKPTGQKPKEDKPKTANELHLAIVRGLDEGLSEGGIRKRIGLD